MIGGGILLKAAALCLTGFNVWDGWRAGRESQKVLEQMAGNTVENRTDLSGVSELSGEEKRLPVIPVDGNDYIGVLEIPDQNLALPVMEDWSYPKLRIAPCRYKGSAEEKDLIIAGHNYDRHFGGLKQLSPGDPVEFTDVEGICYRYEVAEVLTMEGTAVEEMETGDWDMTLFTCTIGGQFRVAVRCALIEDDQK